MEGNPVTSIDSTVRQKLATLTADVAPMRISEIVLKTSRFDEMKLWYQGVLGVAPFYEHSPGGGGRAGPRRRAGGGGGVHQSTHPPPAGAPRAPAGARQERASDIRLCFIRLHLDHPYTQVLAIFDVPGTRDQPSGDPGLHHVQFRNATMDDLFARYDRLKSIGMLPHRTANHGPGTSFYYRDPDQNVVELSASNFASAEDYKAYFTSESYRRNPSGIEIDADDYVARYRSGTSLADLVRIPA